MLLTRRLLLSFLIAAVPSVPAAAQAGPCQVVWFDDFEAGLGNWTAGGEWGLDTESTPCAKQAAPFPSAVGAARCGSPKVGGQPCDYQEGGSFLSLVTPVDIPATATAAALELESFSDVECESCGYDDRFVLVYADGLPVVYEQLTGPLQAWTTVSIDLSPYVGQSILVVFYFETYDEEMNDGIGWLVDDVRITADEAPSYCTAGTSAAGCRALLSGVGTPSASSSSGFVVSACTVEGNRPGIFFWGFNGAQALQWGNGTSYHCVVPPVLRGPLMQTSGGAPGSCQGSFALDLNAYWSSAPPTKVPLPGQGVHLQLWYRDSASTSNQGTSLSDGLQFTAGP